jgi:hypothetical protein
MKKVICEINHLYPQSNDRKPACPSMYMLKYIVPRKPDPGIGREDHGPETSEDNAGGNFDMWLIYSP